MPSELVASKDKGKKGRVLDRPMESRSHILSYSTVLFSASSAGFHFYAVMVQRAGG